MSTTLQSRGEHRWFHQRDGEQGGHSAQRKSEVDGPPYRQQRLLCRCHVLPLRSTNLRGNQGYC